MHFTNNASDEICVGGAAAAGARPRGGGAPYARQMLSVLNSLATRVPEESHPLLARRGDENVELVVISADRGLCGGYNTNILRQALEFLWRHAGREVELNIIGKRARDFFRRRSYAVRHEAINVLQKPSFGDAAAIARDLIDGFVNGKKDQVWLVYNEFKSVVQQRVVVEPLLPIQRLEHPDDTSRIEYLYDEAPAKIYGNLLPRHVEAQSISRIAGSSGVRTGSAHVRDGSGDEQCGGND